MARWMLMVLLFALHGDAWADLPTWLGEAGLVEVDASAINAWNRESSRAFHVSVLDASSCIQITISEEAHRASLSREEGDYEYLGTDNGEWGGELIATGPKGKRSVLIEDNIRALIPTGDGLLVFTGLPHLGLSRGAVYRIISPDREPSIELVTLLPDAPDVVVPLRSETDLWQVAIIGTSSVMMLSSFSGRVGIEVELIRQPWWGLYPNSGVSMDGYILFGMRGGVGVVQSPRFGQVMQPPRYFTLDRPSKATSDAEAVSESEPGDLHVCGQEVG